MRVNVEWLREWVDVPGDALRLADELTTAGLEVEDVLAAAPLLDGVVVARVLDVRPHPEADRLTVCEVDAGGAPLRVVCGAPNVRPGATAALAPPGTRLPDKLIESVEVRGVESAGMLCSAKELGLSEDGAGILLLDPEAPIGVPLREYLKLDDAVLDIAVTPNRGDCFSVIGIAREVAALREGALTPPTLVEVPALAKDVFPVALEAGNACPRFAGRVIRNVRQGEKSPLWMTERLRRAGVRAIHPVVDVTNYVMLELGQPLHAYDLHRLSERIVVRFARPGETLMLLDGRRAALDADVLVIADASGPIGLAGVMGGAGTGVEAETRDVFLESAFFAPQAIAGRARRFNLHTEASLRFERGVDPVQQERAVERATQLLLAIAGGEPGPLVCAELHEHVPRRPPVPLRAARIEALLGQRIEPGRVERLLGLLEMQCERREDGWLVTPPSFRFDVAIEEDLVEEVARLVGYDDIPVTRGAGAARLGTATETRVEEEAVADLLVGRGYNEVVTYSFVDEKLDEMLHGAAEQPRPPVKLANPIASDMNVMRRSLWPGLLSTARQNLSRQRARVRIFEIGREFFGGDAGVVETAVVAGLAIGPCWPEHWDLPDREVDFFDVKADLEALLALTGRAAELSFERARHPALTPGSTARVLVGRRPVGWLGALHPRLNRSLDVARNVVLFSLELEGALEARVPAFRAYSRLPFVRRDLAVVVDENVQADELVAHVRSAAGELLQDVTVFDIYRGPGVDSSRKSIALGLILQGVSRTLTDVDADDIVLSVTRRLERELNAAIRK